MPRLSDKQLARLVMRCVQPESKFRELGEYNEKDKTIYIDRGGSILAVAHLDTVKYNKPNFSNGHIITGTLDDRLGAWGILDAIPRLTRTKYDILLTTDEEVGDSSAGKWTIPEGKKYNWMFSLDRRGLDVVTYCYEEKEWLECLKSNGFTIGNGSVSDISYLERLECSGVNFGIGYHNEHTESCHANLGEVAQRVLDIAKFITANSKTEFKHKPSNFTKRGRSYYSNNTYSGYGSGYGSSGYVGAGSRGSTSVSSKAYDGDGRFKQLEDNDEAYVVSRHSSNNSTPDTKSLDCGKCGAFTEGWWNYCAECGFKLNEYTNLYDSDYFMVD